MSYVRYLYCIMLHCLIEKSNVLVYKLKISLSVLRIRISEFGHEDSSVQYVISLICSFSHLRV